jgi:FXSXX-COOH protein
VAADEGQPGTGAEGGQQEWRSDMIDVTGLSLRTLVEATADDDSALAATLRRLADDLATPGEPVAGFNSAL